MKKKNVWIMITVGMFLCAGCQGQDTENPPEVAAIVQEEQVLGENVGGGASEPGDTSNAANETNTANAVNAADTANASDTANAVNAADTASTDGSEPVSESAPIKTEQPSGDAAPASGKAVIEGFLFADGREVPVKVSMTLEKTQRGEEAYKILASADQSIAEPNSDEEYIIFTFDISYDDGELDEIDLMENRASLENAGLYFALSNGDSNAEDMTSHLSSSIYNLTISKGMSAKGEAAFLHKTDSNEPLHFVGFGKDTVFTVQGADEAREVKESSQTEKAIVCGQIIGDWGIGYLIYAISGQNDEDYRLYFLESEDRQMPLSEVDVDLEAVSYTFPDVRTGNVSIGKFSDIYYIDTVDLIGDGRTELFIVARYEKDGRKCYDTRIYDMNENGASANYDSIQKLNEKYCNVEDYPVEEAKRLFRS